MSDQENGLDERQKKKQKISSSSSSSSSSTVYPLSSSCISLEKEEKTKNKWNSQTRGLLMLTSSSSSSTSSSSIGLGTETNGGSVNSFTLPPTLSELDQKKEKKKRKRMAMEEDIMAKALRISSTCTCIDSDRQCRLLLKEGQSELLRVFPQVHRLALDELELAQSDLNYPLSHKRILLHLLLDNLPSFCSSVEKRCDPVRFAIYKKNIGACSEAFLGGQALFQYYRKPGQPCIPIFPLPEHFENAVSAYGSIVARVPT